MVISNNPSMKESVMTSETADKQEPGKQNTAVMWGDIEIRKSTFPGMTACVHACVYYRGQSEKNSLCPINDGFRKSEDCPKKN